MQNENKELQSCLVSWRVFSFTVLLFMIHMRIMLKLIVLLRDYVSVGGVLFKFTSLVYVSCIIYTSRVCSCSQFCATVMLLMGK